MCPCSAEGSLRCASPLARARDAAPACGASPFSADAEGLVGRWGGGCSSPAPDCWAWAWHTGTLAPAHSSLHRAKLSSVAAASLLHCWAGEIAHVVAPAPPQCTKLGAPCANSPAQATSLCATCQEGESVILQMARFSAPTHARALLKCACWRLYAPLQCHGPHKECEPSEKDPRCCGRHWGQFGKSGGPKVPCHQVCGRLGPPMPDCYQLLSKPGHGRLMPWHLCLTTACGSQPRAKLSLQ